MKTITFKKEIEDISLDSAEIKSEVYQINISGNDRSKLEIEFSAEIPEELEESQLEEIFELDIDEDHTHMELITKRHPKVKKATFDIKIPIDTTLEIDNNHAKILIENISNSIEIANKHGKLTLNKITGDLEIKNSNGSIGITDQTGNLEISNQNGPLKLKNCLGNIEIISSNGAIRLTNCSGELECKSQNGMIQIGQSRLTSAEISNSNGMISYEFDQIDDGNFEFTNNNGQIQLIIPNELEYDLSARSRMGRINIGIPGDYEQSRDGGYKQIEMIKASGKVKIEASNKMGGISLSNSPRKNRSYDFDFDTSDFTENFDPEKIKQVVKESMANVKRGLENIDIPDIRELKQTILSKIKKSIPDESDFDIIKEEIDNELETPNPEGDMQKSRMKILELLQAGKISVEDAEKLLKAIGGK